MQPTGGRRSPAAGQPPSLLRMAATGNCWSTQNVWYAGFEREVVDPPVSVPEPAAIALLGLALGGLGIVSRRRQY